MIDRLTSIIKEFKKDSSLEINENTVLVSDLDLDSFDLVQLVCDIEDEFDIRIPDKALKNFITVGDVVKYIESQK